MFYRLRYTTNTISWHYIAIFWVIERFIKLKNKNRTTQKNVLANIFNMLRIILKNTNY